MKDFLFSFPPLDTSSEFQNLPAIGTLNTENVANIDIDLKRCKLGGKVSTDIHKYNDEDSEGEYHTLNLKKWKEIPVNKIDDGRLYAGRDYKNRKARVFIQKEARGEIDTCKYYIQFNKHDWYDFRKPRGEDKFKWAWIGDNGVIYIGNLTEITLLKSPQFKVFVLIEKKQKKGGFR